MFLGGKLGFWFHPHKVVLKLWVKGDGFIFTVSACATLQRNLQNCPNWEISVQIEVTQINACIKIDLGPLMSNYIKWKCNRNSKNTQIKLWEGQRKLAERDMNVCRALFLPSPSLCESVADKEANSAGKKAAQKQMLAWETTKLQNGEIHNRKTDKSTQMQKLVPEKAYKPQST